MFDASVETLDSSKIIARSKIQFEAESKRAGRSAKLLMAQPKLTALSTQLANLRSFEFMTDENFIQSSKNALNHINAHSLRTATSLEEIRVCDNMEFGARLNYDNPDPLPFVAKCISSNSVQRISLSHFNINSYEITDFGSNFLQTLENLRQLFYFALGLLASCLLILAEHATLQDFHFKELDYDLTTRIEDQSGSAEIRLAGVAHIKDTLLQSRKTWVRRHY